MYLKDRMNNGLLYRADDKDLMAEQAQMLEKLYDFNDTRPSQVVERNSILKEMFAEIGENCYIEPPLRSNWACSHVHFGDYVYANFNLTLVDDSEIYVGNNVMFGPNVIVATAGHPILPELREIGYQFNADVHIGDNVWIGGGAIILPGVSIGNNSVIGAGAVVTKDVPDNVVAVGNPCRVLREINEKDKEYYFKNRKIDWENLKD